jgi:hypothetical protein
MDVYNPQCYKASESKLRRVHVSQQVTQNDEDESYVSKCQFKAQEAISVYNPNIIFFVAGYDVLKGDRYGKMKITDGGCIARDEEIMRYAISRGIPIVYMIGNTFKSSSECISNSIRNMLYKLQLSHAPVKYPTADRMRGITSGGKQGVNMRAAVEQDLNSRYMSQGTLHSYRYEDPREAEMLNRVEPHISEDTRRTIRE